MTAPQVQLRRDASPQEFTAAMIAVADLVRLGADPEAVKRLPPPSVLALFAAPVSEERPVLAKIARALEAKAEAERAARDSPSGVTPSRSPSGPASPIDPGSQPLVDKILAGKAANPHHDHACLFCGGTYVEAEGHTCAGPASGEEQGAVERPTGEKARSGPVPSIDPALPPSSVPNWFKDSFDREWDANVKLREEVGVPSVRAPVRTGAVEGPRSRSLDPRCDQRCLADLTSGGKNILDFLNVWWRRRNLRWRR